MFKIASPFLTGKFLHADVKATPHKDRLTALHVICLQIFHHITQKFLEIRPKGVPMVRQYSFKIFMQSNEQSDCASDTRSLCGVVLRFSAVKLC